MLPDFRLEAYFSRWEFKARYNLAASDAETVSIGELLEMGADGMGQRWQDLRLGYTQTFGDPDLRAALAGTYESIRPSDILCFSGGEEALYCAMQVLLERDDHAVVIAPNYQSTEEIPLSRCRVSGVLLREDHGWELDLDELREAITARTRVIAINFPNNPTGASIQRATLDGIIELARRQGAYLFADEAYRGLERDPGHRLPQAADLYERALSLGVLSKAYGLPGLRIGWIACRDPVILSRLERFKHYLSICNSAPSELLGCIAVAAREDLWRRNVALVSRNLGLLADFLARWPLLFEAYAPDGGCVLFARYRGADGVEAFCQRAVEEAGVLLLPASVFASRLCRVPTDRFRIGIGRRDFSAGLLTLERHLTTIGEDQPDP